MLNILYRGEESCMRNLLYFQLHSILCMLLSDYADAATVCQNHPEALYSESLCGKVHSCTGISGFWVVTSKAECKPEPEHTNLCISWYVGK